MKEPELDEDAIVTEDGTIQRKRSNTIRTKICLDPIPQFLPEATLGEMRAATGKDSEEAIRRAAAKIGKK